jgi:hypothetical protein
MQSPVSLFFDRRDAVTSNLVLTLISSKVYNWVITEILESSDIEDQSRVISFFIEVAEVCI